MLETRTINMTLNISLTKSINARVQSLIVPWRFTHERWDLKYPQLSRLLGFSEHFNCTSCLRSSADLFFFSVLFQKDEVYLNLVLDYVPETVYRVARHYSRAKQTLPMIYVKVGNWQMWLGEERYYRSTLWILFSDIIINFLKFLEANRSWGKEKRI